MVALPVAVPQLIEKLHDWEPADVECSLRKVGESGCSGPEGKLHRGR